MNRRSFLLTIPIGGGLALGCSAGARLTRVATYSEIESTNPNKEAAPTVLVCMPRTSQALEVWTGLRDELAKDFRLVGIEVAGRESSSIISEGLRRHRPSAIVLMNNPTLAAYREVQRVSADKHFPPAVVVMVSFLERRPREMIATTGISYEVPLITVVTNLRKLMTRPIQRIGIVTRSDLRSFVEHQANLAAREQISVIVEEVSVNPNAPELKRALRIVKQGADALWILNDDRLLTPRLITDGWLPGLNERPWVPAIVGAPPLVSPGSGFGTFAVLPDHTALGAQTANIILDLADNRWELPDDADVQLPLSTTATIDLVQVRDRFVLRPDALLKVDRVLQ
jgi:hypothetical protein